jgi:capsular exopolysaccharide synthesis family protein
MSQTKKISNLNSDFDLRLLLRVARKNIAWIILFFILATLIAFLYLRYTHPIYQASSTIQITASDKTSNFLIKNDFIKNDLSARIELLRSPVFLNKVFNKLKLEYIYYIKGSVLNSELYTSNPYRVEILKPTENIYNIPFYVNFIDESNLRVKYTISNKETIEKLPTNTWVKTDFADSVRINVTNYDKIKSDQKGTNEFIYFFVNVRKENLVRLFTPFLEIKVKNESAGTIQITFKERNPNKVADICNNIVEEFKIYDVEKQAESSRNIISFVDEQLNIMYDKLYDSERAVQNFKLSNNVLEYDALPDFAQRITNLEKEKLSVDNDFFLFENLEKDLREEKDIDVYKLISLVAGLSSGTMIDNQLGNIQQLLTKKEEALYSKTINNTAIAKLDFQLNIQKQLLFEAIKVHKNNLLRKKEDVEKRIADYQKEIDSFNSGYDRLEFIKLNKLNEINAKYYNKLVEIKSELTIAVAGITPENAVLEYAIIPTSPLFPEKRKVALGALIGWLFASLGLIVLRYLFHNEITSLNEIMSYIDIPVLGIIPNYRDVIPVSQLIVDKKPKSLIAESLRAIRSNLEFLSTEDGPKVLAITSTISGEGKTFVAMNLAGIIAFSEKKVVIIDLDMRKPKIHVGFGVSNDRGMSTILIGRTKIEDCIYNSSLKNLDFITAGPVPPNPSELILSKRMSEVLDELKTKYDLIVVDNPPVGLVTDGIKIFKLADYPIYVFRENYSKRNFVANVNKLIHDNNINNLSIVMNNVDIKRSGYGYSGVYDYDYGYGYGYGFGYYDEDIRRERFNIVEYFKRLINKS